MVAKSHVFPIYGSFTLHGTGTGTGTGKRWISVLRYVLYTLHRDRDRDMEPLFSIVLLVPCPGPSPGSMQCV